LLLEFVAAFDPRLTASLTVTETETNLQNQLQQLVDVQQIPRPRSR